VVQRFPSSQTVPFALTGFEQTPVVGSQAPAAWHWSSALHVTGLPAPHAPPEQRSPIVQALPSSQALVLWVWTQPVAGSHESSVQGLLSSQASGAPPWQAPPPQASPAVQASPSSHPFVLFVRTHPDSGSHVSDVHELPSSHNAELSVNTQPVAGLQESSVQAL
jgi:hypothetical protein